MNEDRRDKEFKIPIQYQPGQPPIQVEFPTKITTRKGALHFAPGMVKFIGAKELEFLKNNVSGLFKVLVIEKIVIKKSPQEKGLIVENKSNKQNDKPKSLEKKDSK